jgi:very-short-patch-repair endonuclease
MGLGVLTPPTSGKRPISTAVVKTNAELARLGRSQPEETLALQLNGARIRFLREVRPFSERKFRFDFLVERHGMFAMKSTAWLIEVEGGIWQKGGHSSGTGITRDIEKGNLAALAGWRVLRFTHDMIKDGRALKTIEQALGETDANH